MAKNTQRSIRSIAAGSRLQPEYDYKPLGNRQIRLVHLQPGGEGDEIHCDIQHISIDADPDFEALSYTWGASGERFSIRVGPASSLLVGKNLFVALKALRSSDETRIIWIDAICINQSDSLERNHQVSFMKDIYTRASSVFIWLGEAADGSDEIMKYMASLDARTALVEHRAWIDYSLSDTWDWASETPFKEPPIAQSALEDLLRRPWFSRVWIQQEAAANAVTKVVCGSMSVTWDQLFSMAWNYQKPSGNGFAKDKLHIDAAVSSLLVITIQSYRYNDVPNLLIDILRDCTHCGATDPRDMIYGIQSLANDPELDKLLLEPNYDDSVPTIYAAMAKRFLASQDPFIVSWAGRNNQNLREIPSWAPDWTVKNIELPSVIFRAAGSTKGDCEVITQDGKEFLSVTGLIISSIDSVGCGPVMTQYRAQVNDPEVFQKLRANLKACMDLARNVIEDSATSLTWQDLWRTLATDSTRLWTRLGSTYADDFDTFPDWLDSHKDGASCQVPEPYLEYFEILNIRRVFIKRRFAMDSKGNMCIIPYYAKAGDLTIVIAGLSLPLVVRARAGGGIEIIGECYVHGSMDGEAVEGLGPQEYKKFRIF